MASAGPERIGKYELLKFLGGGMSHVYRARDTVMDRIVAVKILTEQGCTDADSKARFLQEAKITCGFAHDNIIRIHDYGEDDGRPFMVMEFLTGSDLRDAIRGNLTGDLKNRLGIAVQVARALEFVHSKNVVHRDIKPENLHLDPAGRVRLMDFGIAKSHDLSLTKTGLALGTPYYMAPEQILGHPPTAQVDIYAYGILLYELLTGQKPVTGDTVERLFYMILHEPLNLQPLVDASIPQPVIDLVSRCTAKKKEDRIQTFGEVIVALEEILRGDAPPKPVAAPVPVEAAAGSNKLLWVVAAVILLLAAGAAWFFFGRGTAATGQQTAKVLAPVLNLDSGEMRLVPAGTFLSGEQKQPATVDAYYIDRTEVTNGAYQRFCAAKNRPLPAGFSVDRPNDPVVNVTIVDAQEFAKWAGKRLPTAAEWEKALRGSDGRVYSWGDQEDPLRANVNDNPQSKGIAPAGADSLTAAGRQRTLVYRARRRLRPSAQVRRGLRMDVGAGTFCGSEHRLPLREDAVSELLYISVSAATKAPLAVVLSGSSARRTSDSSIGNCESLRIFSKRSRKPLGSVVPPLSTSGMGRPSLGRFRSARKASLSAFTRVWITSS
ncbi:MAG: protein kinase [Acidobacteria bacterium]|nr:protein kinase [Acidobacteriota bacterium]